MGYTTKFNIGDTVWFTEEETIYGTNCQCCNSRLPDSKAMKIHKTTVKEIFIKSGYNKIYEQYNLSYPRSLSEDKLYATKNEAEESIKIIESIKLAPSGLPNQYWQGDKLIVRMNVAPEELA